MKSQSVPSATRLTCSLVLALICIQLAAAPARAQEKFDAGKSALARPRIMEEIDDSATVRIPDSTPRVLRNAVDQGRMDGSTKMGPMFLILNSSPEQEQALQTLLRQQQDRSSANYHRWLTPDEFGTAFGVHQIDLQQMSNWLTNQGFEVDDVALGRRSVTFRGTAAQVEEAFHTEMHNFLVNGERHFANSIDFSIPEALAPVVTGVSGLNDFKPRPPRTPVHAVNRGANTTQGPQPEYYWGNRNYISPGDFSIIFNTQPLLQENVDGRGVTIGVVGESANIQANDANITNFRTIFLPSYPANDFNIIAVPSSYSCGAPITSDATLDQEGYLDVEWSGAVAPKAIIDYVPTGDALCSAQYLVESNTASIISLSFETCEAGWGTSYGFINSMWEQAAAQGITVFVGSGDSGSADCDYSYPAYQGYAVNGIASTPFNVAVGGSDFYGSLDWSFTPASTPSTNYSTPVTNLAYTSATGYVPENPWNDSAYGTNITAGGGGISQCSPLPLWQVGPGVPPSDPVLLPTLNCGLPAVTGQHRYLPDVTLPAGDQYIVCYSASDCVLIPDGTVQVSNAGGTSASSPAFAGIQALIDQQYGRQGQANYVYYQLAAKQDTSACDSTSSGGPASFCVFNDITVGGIGVPCQAGSADCPTSGPLVLPNFNAGPGYDLATGLGSANVSNLFNQWNTVSAAPSIAISSVSPGSVTLVQGGSAQAVTVNLTNTNYTGSVTLSTSTLPSGVTATITQPGTGSSGSISLQAASNATLVNNQTITITASGSGVSSVTSTFSLTVSQVPSIAISSVSPGSVTLVQGGSSQAVTVNLTDTNYTGSVTLSTSTLPTGVTATITQPGTGSSGSISLQAASNAALVSNQTITITSSGSGVSPVTTTFSLTVNPVPSIAISSVSPGAVTLVPGGSSQAVTVNLTDTNYTGSVTLSTSTLPTGVTATITQPGTGSSGSISLQAASNATLVNNQTITITASGSGVSSVTSTFSLTVSAVPVAGVSPIGIGFNPQPVGTTSVSVTVTLNNTGSAALTLSGIATSTNFGQTNNCGSSVAAGGSCTINVTFSPTSTGALTGTLTVTDNSNGVVGSTQTVTLSGTGTQPSIAISSVSPGAVTLVQGGSAQAVTVNLTDTNYTGSVTLSTSTLPTGVTATITQPGTGSSGSISLQAASNAALVNNQTITITASGSGVSSVTSTFSLTVSAVPVAGVSPGSLTFGTQMVNTTSAAQTATLSNTGNATLTITNIVASSNFTQTNNCGGSVTAGGSCTIDVTFTPSAAGYMTGALTITDNNGGATGSTQSVALSGTAQDFSFAPPSGSSTSASVAPGSPAIYTLSVGGQGGLSGTVGFTCTGVPSEATCTVSPNPATVGGSATNVTITISTTAASAGGPRARPLPPAPPLSGGLRRLLMFALFLGAIAWAIRRRNQWGVGRWQPAIVLFAAGLLLTIAITACGGGGSGGGSTPPQSNPGTPAGTYTLTVTGTTGSGTSTLSHSVTLTLIVS